MEEQLEFYRENGYLVVPDALSTEQVRTINECIERDLVENRSFWYEKDKLRTLVNVHILLAQPEMDITMRPPALLPWMEAIMGSELCAEEHSVRIRYPNPDGPVECHWHRDSSRPDSDVPFHTRYLSIVFYLTDVDETTHTFSVLPRSAQSDALGSLDDYDLSKAHHIVGPAGTAILFNAVMFHAGNHRQTTSERRTIHIYCGRRTDRYLSNYTIFPRRLWQGQDEATQKYYGRPNPATQLMLQKF